MSNVRRSIVGFESTIERRTFDIVQSYLAKNIVPPDRFAQWDMTDLLMKKWGPVDFNNIEPFKNQAIVTYRRGTFKVSDFLRWYDARSANLHLSLSSPRIFFTSLEGYVWRM